VGENGDFDLAPGKQKVGMMALFLRYRSDAIDEIESRPKVGKTICAEEVVVMEDFPIRQFRAQRFDYFGSERRYAAPAGNAGLVG